MKALNVLSSWKQNYGIARNKCRNRHEIGWLPVLGSHSSYLSAFIYRTAQEVTGNVWQEMESGTSCSGGRH